MWNMLRKWPTSIKTSRGTYPMILVPIKTTKDLSSHTARILKGTRHLWKRPVFSIGVSNNMHQLTNLYKFGLNWSSKLQENNGRKHPCCTNCVCFQMLNPRLQLQSVIMRMRNNLFLKNYVSSEWAYSHNVVYYQQLSITRYQLNFCSNSVQYL